jgi:hypothetical protein
MLIKRKLLIWGSTKTYQYFLLTILSSPGERSSAITWHRFMFFSDNDSRVCGVRTFLVKVKFCSSTLSNQIMKRKFEQWCLTIQTIATKRTNNFKNLHSFASTHRETSHGHTKQNDNISMESTLAGPMNARS